MIYEKIKNLKLSNFNNDSTLLKVLTVDDSPTIYRHLNYLFQDLKFVDWIGHAFNIEMAKNIILENKPDIIVLDIMLNDENGFDLLVELNEIFNNCKIIILSNLNDVIYSEKSKTLGANYYLDKSFEFHKIEDLLLLEYKNKKCA
jgi:two-component system response regulator LytT